MCWHGEPFTVNKDLLHSYHGKGVGCVLCFIAYSLPCVSGILHCACPAWLCLQVRCKHTQIHILLFFHEDKTTIHLPHDMQQQSMHYSYIQSWKPAVIGCSNGQHQDQYSRWRHGVTFSGQRASYYKG